MISIKSDGKKDMQKLTINGKQITRFYSGGDHHTYWTLVIDTKTTAKDARVVISEKLGDDTVSPNSFSIVLEGDTTVIPIGDNDRLLDVKAGFKKKRKKEGEPRFVLQGLNIVNNNVNYTSPDSSSNNLLSTSNSNNSLANSSSTNSLANTSSSTSLPNTSSNLSNNHTDNHHNNHTNSASNTPLPSPPPSPKLNNATGPHYSQSASSSEDERTPTTNKPTPAKIAFISSSQKAKKYLSLIHVFYNNHIYWTLAIDPTCTVEDVCKILGDKLGSIDTRVTLHEVEMGPLPTNNTNTPQPELHPDTHIDHSASTNTVNNTNNNDDTTSTATYTKIFEGLTPNMTVRKLSDDVLIHDVLQRWGKHSNSRLFVKEERIWTDEDKLKLLTKRDNAQLPILVCASEEMDGYEEGMNSMRPASATFAPLRPLSSTFAPMRPGSSSFAPLRPGSSSFAPINPDEMRKNPINMWIRESDIKLVKKISSGAFAKVFKGIYKDVQVAIKVLKGSLTEENITNFKNEFAILSQIQSTNLVQFYGACIEKKLTMVMEYCPRGSLYHVMKDPNEVIGWRRVLDFFTQTVKGIECLHTCTPPILHRDLKSLNILVSENWEVKVADFGLSRFNTLSNHSSLGRICGTMAYCAPEVYKGERFGVKSDIYSLGIILWELVVRCISKQYKPPFSEYPFISFDFQIIIQTSQNGLRPTLPPECPPVITSLIQRCWHGDPDIRPTCAEILTTLDALRGEIEKDPQRIGITL